MTTLTWGKYKGKTYEQVYDNYKQYCRWILGQMTEHDDIKEFQRYLELRGLGKATNLDPNNREKPIGK